MTPPSSSPYSRNCPRRRRLPRSRERSRTSSFVRRDQGEQQPCSRMSPGLLPERSSRRRGRSGPSGGISAGRRRPPRSRREGGGSWGINALVLPSLSSTCVGISFHMAVLLKKRERERERDKRVYAPDNLGALRKFCVGRRARLVFLLRTAPMSKPTILILGGLGTLSLTPTPL